MPNMYPQPDAPDATSTDTPAQDGEHEPDKMEGETALLPKSILGGKEFNPGDEVVLKIVGLHDDEVEVTYAPEKSKASDDDQDKPDTSEMGAAQNRMTSLAGPGSGGGY